MNSIHDDVSDLPWWEELYQHLQYDMNMADDREYANQAARLLWNER